MAFGLSAGRLLLAEKTQAMADALGGCAVYTGGCAMALYLCKAAENPVAFARTGEYSQQNRVGC
jgi:hypothetical protein